MGQRARRGARPIVARRAPRRPPAQPPPSAPAPARSAPAEPPGARPLSPRRAPRRPPAKGRLALGAALALATPSCFFDSSWELAAGRLAEAWAKAEPLFGRYPKAYEVQELRCQLAMKRGGSMPQVRSHCERLLQLTDEMTKRPRPK
ncbi:MAG TPA: hypothetical protein VFS43_10640 [Polyangiaceae bacterium]|nr:hypothetical protein [Polyangiaceae bacterium]